MPEFPEIHVVVEGPDGEERRLTGRAAAVLMVSTEDGSPVKQLQAIVFCPADLAPVLHEALHDVAQGVRRAVVANLLRELAAGAAPLGPSIN